MMDLRLEHVSCNLCKGDDAKVVFRKKRPGFERPFTIVRCRQCGLVYLNPRVAHSQIGALYGSEYFLERGFDAVSPEQRCDAEILARCIKNAMLDPRSVRPRLLDIGSLYYGLFALAATDFGFNAELVDVSEHAVTIARKRGVNCLLGEITDPIFDERAGSYDVITAMEVVEHSYDPMAFFKRVYLLLKPRGVFVYSTGNFQETRFKRASWVYFSEIPYHVYFFTPVTVRTYLQSAGFDRFLNPYEYIYNNRDVAIRLLSRLGFIDLRKDTVPHGLASRLAYSVGFPFLATLTGRRRLPFAVKL